MKRYCAFEPGRYDEGQFDLVRGDLWLHHGGRLPLHTNDGALVPSDPIHGPDGDGGPIVGPTIDASLRNDAPRHDGGVI
jgi:hypothetical protein